MKKVLVILACFCLIASASTALAVEITQDTPHTVTGTDFTITASKGVTLTVTSDATTYDANATHESGSGKTYYTTQDSGITDTATGS